MTEKDTLSFCSCTYMYTEERAEIIFVRRTNWPWPRTCSSFHDPYLCLHFSRGSSPLTLPDVVEELRNDHFATSRGTRRGV